MARRYTRDNRGRFASVGATARGGRLRTAAGNKRATQTKEISGGKPGGTIGKPAGLKPSSSKPASSATPAQRQRVRGNFRPQNTMAKPSQSANPFGKKKGENIEIAQAGITAAGFSSRVTNKRKDANTGSPASSNVAFGLVSLNKADSHWSNPRRNAIEQRRLGQWSTSDPRGVVLHEIGHLKDKSSGWINTSSGGMARRGFASTQNQRLAARVSKYATTSPREFTAETYAGLRTGRKYDAQVMRAYRQEKGTKAPSIRSQLKRKSK